MKKNTKDTDSVFEKSFAKYPSKKKKFWSRSVQQKLFVFDIFTSFKKSWWSFSILYLQRLQFYVICSSRSSKQFCNFVSGVNLSEYFTHTIPKQAWQFFLQENYFRLQLSSNLHVFLRKSFISNTGLKILKKIKEKVSNIWGKS